MSLLNPFGRSSSKKSITGSNASLNASSISLPKFLNVSSTVAKPSFNTSFVSNAVSLIPSPSVTKKSSHQYPKSVKSFFIRLPKSTNPSFVSSEASFIRSPNFTNAFSISLPHVVGSDALINFSVGSTILLSIQSPASFTTLPIFNASKFSLFR